MFGLTSPPAACRRAAASPRCRADRGRTAHSTAAENPGTVPARPSAVLAARWSAPRPAAASRCVRGRVSSHPPMPRSDPPMVRRRRCTQAAAPGRRLPPAPGAWEKARPAVRPFLPRLPAPAGPRWSVTRAPRRAAAGIPPRKTRPVRRRGLGSAGASMRPRVFPAEDHPTVEGTAAAGTGFNEAAGIPRGRHGSWWEGRSLNQRFNEAAGIPRGRLCPQIRMASQLARCASMRPRVFPAEDRRSPRLHSIHKDRFNEAAGIPRGRRAHSSARWARP